MTPALLRRWRLIATAAYLALFSWMGLWLFRGDSSPSLIALTIGWGPLWLPLYGILRGRIYTFAWSNFVVIPYLGHALMLAWVNPLERDAAIIEGSLAMAALLLIAYYTRFAARYHRLHGSDSNTELGLDADDKVDHR